MHNYWQGCDEGKDKPANRDHAGAPGVVNLREMIQTFWHEDIAQFTFDPGILEIALCAKMAKGGGVIHGNFLANLFERHITVGIAAGQLVDSG